MLWLLGIMKRKFQLSPFICSSCVYFVSFFVMKQQANIKYCFKPRTTASRLATGCRNEAVWHMCVFEWFKGFIWGCERIL